MPAVPAPGKEARRMRTVRIALGLLVAATVVGLPWAYAAYRQANYRNFRVVTPGVLYRSGQLSLAGLERAVHDYGIRTVVTLRDADVAGEEPPDRAEEEFCADRDIRYVRIRPERWWSPTGGPVPAEAGVRRFLAVMDDPANHPVLVHCFAGVHRTGAMVAIYRMEYDHWPAAQALDELRVCGYRNLDDEWDVLGYLEAYRPRWWARLLAGEAAEAVGGRR
jgi:protein tyrosine/serine phosphatase